MNNFKLEEFDCPCCKGNAMRPKFLEMIDEARRLARISFIINSGYRCEKHNKEVGSTSDNHPSGQAADIKCMDGLSRFKIVESLIKSGFTRIGIAKTFIHADCMDKPTSIWFY